MLVHVTVQCKSYIVKSVLTCGTHRSLTSTCQVPAMPLCHVLECPMTYATACALRCPGEIGTGGVC